MTIFALLPCLTANQTSVSGSTNHDLPAPLPRQQHRSRSELHRGFPARRTESCFRPPDRRLLAHPRRRDRADGQDGALERRCGWSRWTSSVGQMPGSPVHPGQLPDPRGSARHARCFSAIFAGRLMREPDCHFLGQRLRQTLQMGQDPPRLRVTAPMAAVPPR